MTESIPVNLIEKWIHDLTSVLKQASQKTEDSADYFLHRGMREGVSQVHYTIKTWLRHQGNVETLGWSGKKFLITKDVNLSGGRYRKLEWYEGNLFISLAWRHAQGAESGELMLEMQHVQELSTTYLIYEGDLSFDELARLARKGGLDSLWDEGNRQEWVEKT